MHLEVLVHPKGVEGLGIKTGEEHTDDDEQVNVAVLHAERYIFVVVAELVTADVVAGTECLVVGLDGLCEEILGDGGHLAHIVRVFFRDIAVFVFLFVGGVGEDSGYLHVLVATLFELTLKLVVVCDSAGDGINGKDGVETV